MNNKEIYIIDTKASTTHFIVKDTSTGFNIKVSKAKNTLDDVKKLVGLINIKEVI